MICLHNGLEKISTQFTIVKVRKHACPAVILFRIPILIKLRLLLQEKELATAGADWLVQICNLHPFTEYLWSALKYWHYHFIFLKQLSELADELKEITNLRINGADCKSAPASHQICTSITSNLHQPWLSPWFLRIISSNAAATGLSIPAFFQ